MWPVKLITICRLIINSSLHYCCFQVVDTNTKSLLISDTVEFRHDFLHTPKASYKDRILHAIYFLFTTIQDATSNAVNDQLIAIDQLCAIFNKWNLNTSVLSSPPAPKAQPSPKPMPPPTNIATKFNIIIQALS